MYTLRSGVSPGVWTSLPSTHNVEGRPCCLNVRILLWYRQNHMHCVHSQCFCNTLLIYAPQPITIQCAVIYTLPSPRQVYTASHNPNTEWTQWSGPPTVTCDRHHSWTDRHNTSICPSIELDSRQIAWLLLAYMTHIVQLPLNAPPPPPPPRRLVNGDGQQN